MASVWTGTRTWIVLSVGKRLPTQARAGTTVTFISTDGPLREEWLSAGVQGEPPLRTTR
jgi:hypothetical protein